MPLLALLKSIAIQSVLLKLTSVIVVVQRGHKLLEFETFVIVVVYDFLIPLS